MKFAGRVIFGLLSSVICAAPVMAENGWSLVQTARGGAGAALGGGMTLYITPSGMRTMDPKSGINLMTHGPNWTVYIFNSKTKRVFSSQLQPWLASFKQRNLTSRFEGASWRRGRQAPVAGVNAYEFVMDRPPQLRPNAQQFGARGRRAPQSAVQAANLWVASDIVTPPQVSNILSQLYGVPDCQRIPLRVQLTETGKGQSTAVDTVRVARMNVPDSAFAPPNGYKSVKQDSDVFIDQESMDTLDEMLQDLDAPSTPRRRPVPQRR
ncbi:MAG: hypothetical protein K2X27_28290 [Candidatus Obscuribacterales bacterium]|nr:hypothetical protein [Candidatus Obscuribacterales bacterium]